MTPEWLRDVLVEMGRVAEGYKARPGRACRLLQAVPLEHMLGAGLSPADFGGVVEVIPACACCGEPVADARPPYCQNCHDKGCP